MMVPNTMIAGRAVAKRALLCPSTISNTSSKSFSRRVSFVACKATEQKQVSPTPASTQSRKAGIPYGIVSALAAAGTLETAYLTAAKLFNTPLACPTSGCESVLTSSYSEIFGVPLSLFGMLLYGGVAAVAARAASMKGTASESETKTSDMLLMTGATLLSTCSAVLIYILQAKLAGEVCVWCYGSAALSLALLLTVTSSSEPRALRDMAAPSAGLAAVTFFVMYFGVLEKSQAEDFELAYSKPNVTTESPAGAVDLAHQLREAGAKMYGAFWCSHCFDQKEAFGKEAMDEFPYVECYPDGWKKGVKLAGACTDAGIKAFPTWVIGGKNIEGELDFSELRQELSQLPGVASKTSVASSQ